MRITFLPLHQSTDVPQGTTVLEAAALAGVPLESDCGGKGRCGKCKVVVTGAASAPTARERRRLTLREIQDNVRLACQVQVEAPLEITLGTFTQRREHILETGRECQVALQPLIGKHYLNLGPEGGRGGDALAATILGSLRRGGRRPPRLSLCALRTLPEFPAAGSRRTTAVLSGSEALGFEEGDTTARLCGLAVDIGTTTVVGYLSDLTDGRLLAVDSALNAQTEHGSDVVSRIEYAGNMPGGLHRLRELVVATINRIVDRLCTATGLSPDHIYALVIVGNTPMNHLFWGLSPKALSRSPYTPVTTDGLDASPGEVGVKMNARGRVFSLPLISGFVGSDTVAVVLATGLHRSRVPRMAVDIGTNGEIVATDGRALVACSCAAGPAFEGAHIHSGMRGTSGAIDRITVRGERLDCHVIDDAPAAGLCGSGLVDALAAMLRLRVLEGNGRLRGPGELSGAIARRLFRLDAMPSFRLTGPASGEPEPAVVVTQKDVREVQLAKGALLTGFRILLDRLDLDPGDIRELYLAGAFGNYVRPESAVAIGLLPALPNARLTPVGNAAGSGARMAVLSARVLRESVRIARRIEYVDLARAPGFHEQFIAAMGYPQ